MQNGETQLKPVKEAAKLLSVSPFGLYRKIKAGELPGYRFGRKVLVDITEVRMAMKTVSEKED